MLIQAASGTFHVRRGLIFGEDDQINYHDSDEDVDDEVRGRACLCV